MENKLTRKELATLFYPGRNLELVACLMPMAAPQSRVVKGLRSFGYEMVKADGRVSRLDLPSGTEVFGISEGNGYTHVEIRQDGEVAARYRLL